MSRLTDPRPYEIADPPTRIRRRWPATVLAAALLFLSGITRCSAAPAGPPEATAQVEAKPEPPRTDVPEGINDNFLDPDLDPEEWLKRFEVESREVFSGRAAVLEAVDLQPGHRVADVGSGTGLYVAAFSKAVGPRGQVFAIDISPRLVEFVRDRAQREGLENVTVIRSTPHSITLPEDSVDRVFICDTYHHFEYHADMLKSIRTAMRPGAELILIDFERIPGQSREWILGHVRAGKSEVRGEVEAAGFEFLEEVTVPEFEENYLLRFRRRAD